MPNSTKKTASKQDGDFELRNVLSLVMVGIVALKTVGKILPEAAEHIQSSTENISKHFLTVAKYVAENNAMLPPEVGNAMNKIITGMQFQDRNNQLMQNAGLILESYVGLLKEVNNNLHQMGDSDLINKKEINALIKKILSNIRLSDISVIFKNVLFENGVDYESDDNFSVCRLNIEDDIEVF